MQGTKHVHGCLSPLWYIEVIPLWNPGRIALDHKEAGEGLAQGGEQQGRDELEEEGEEIQI